MDTILNRLPQIIESKDGKTILEPIIYPTAWGKWAIAYKEVFYDGKRPKKIFTVVIEPNNDPVSIEDTIGTINENIGNAPSFEDAVAMIAYYIDENYNIRYDMHNE